jgi:hypothetical protein
VSRFRKQMLEEANQIAMSQQQSERLPETQSKSVFVTYTETITEGEKSVSRTASISLPDDANTHIDEVLKCLRARVEASV